MDANKVWFVTGASKGLGLALVTKLLAEGYKVAATSRTIDSLEKEVGASGNFLPLEVDIVQEASVKNAVEEALAAFGHIDVVVNNAGYGQLGTLEELTDAESRENFDANVFGSLNVIRHIMPHFRSRKAGTIFNIASVGGFTGAFAGWGVYCATKFAMVGFTEALATEAAEFGINATVVYPGYFRTNFLTGGSLRTPVHEIEDYTEARKLQTLHQKDIDGNQPGDPDKAAAALMLVAGMSKPPVHLFLGSDAFQMANGKIEMLQQVVNEHESISRSTDY